MKSTLILLVILPMIFCSGEWTKKRFDSKNDLSDQLALKALLEIPEIKSKNLKFEELLECED